MARYTRLYTDEVFDNHEGRFISPEAAARIPAEEICDEGETTRSTPFARGLLYGALILGAIVLAIWAIGTGGETSRKIKLGEQENFKAVRSIAQARAASL